MKKYSLKTKKKRKPGVVVCTFLIPELWRQRMNYLCQFKVSLSYTVGFKPAWATCWDPISNNNNNKKCVWGGKVRTIYYRNPQIIKETSLNAVEISLYYRLFSTVQPERALEKLWRTFIPNHFTQNFKAELLQDSTGRASNTTSNLLSSAHRPHSSLGRRLLVILKNARKLCAVGSNFSAENLQL